MTSQPNLWQMVYQAHNNYIALRMQVFASPDFDEQIRQALFAPEGRTLALNTLLNVSPNHIATHAAGVFTEAISSNGNSRLARAVLARLDGQEAAKILRPFVDAVLNEWKGDRQTLAPVADMLKELGQETIADEVRNVASRAGYGASERRLSTASSLGDSSVTPVRGHRPKINENTGLWALELRAERVFRSLRAQLINDPRVGEYLSEGLKSNHGRRLAMEIMFELPLSFTEVHIDDVFDDATSTHGNFDYARDLLARLAFDDATAILRPLVEDRLATDDETWEAYLRSAEVLAELGQVELLNYVVARARASDDPDVLMTAELFDGGSFTRLDRVALRENSLAF